jgi:hypothetical protein
MTSIDFTPSDRVALFRLLVEQANVVAAARRDTSRFFLTFNTAAVGAYGYAQANHVVLSPVLLMALTVVMTFVSLLWLNLITYYGRIVSAKFQVIMMLERKFEIQPYDLEEKSVWKGRAPVVGATALEAVIPAFFMLGYVIAALMLGLQFDWPSSLRLSS